jgi:hypothetical protein
MHPSEDMARKNKTPTFKFETTNPGAKGIIANPTITVVITIPGATTKMTLSAKGGIQSSLNNILIMSAKMIRIPSGPQSIWSVAILP